MYSNIYCSCERSNSVELRLTCQRKGSESASICSCYGRSSSCSLVHQIGTRQRQSQTTYICILHYSCVITYNYSRNNSKTNALMFYWKVIILNSWVTLRHYTSYRVQVHVVVNWRCKIYGANIKLGHKSRIIRNEYKVYVLTIHSGE